MTNLCRSRAQSYTRSVWLAVALCFVLAGAGIGAFFAVSGGSGHHAQEPRLLAPPSVVWSQVYNPIQSTVSLGHGYGIRKSH